MSSVIPIYPPAESWSDAKLQAQFLERGEVPKIRLYGNLAQRSQDNEEFLPILKAEMLDEENRNSIFFGFIKNSWIPLLALLDYGSEEAKSQLKDWIVEWTDQERSSFLDYIGSDDEFIAWFKTPSQQESID